jgi:hypothetical protein
MQSWIFCRRVSYSYKNSTIQGLLKLYFLVSCNKSERNNCTVVYKKIAVWPINFIRPYFSSSSIKKTNWSVHVEMQINVLVSIFAFRRLTNRNELKQNVLIIKNKCKAQFSPTCFVFIYLKNRKHSSGLCKKNNKHMQETNEINIWKSNKCYQV